MVSPIADRNPAAFSDGYRMGLLSKFSNKGLKYNSGEGELMMGNQSSLFQWVSGSGSSVSVKLINPWEFSVLESNQEMLNKVASLVNSYVVIHYNQSKVYNPLSSDTGYRVVDIAPMNVQARPTACVASSAVLNRGVGDFSDGVRAGRLVKLSNKGYLQSTKTYEAIMQVGPSGNNFQPMSIAEEAMAKCVMQFVFSGRMAKVTYHQAAVVLDPTSQDSPYEIVKVEPIDPASAIVKSLNDVP